MNVFKLVVSDPKTKKTYQKEVSQKESGLLNRKIGEKIKGDFLGLSGYEIEITGGSDKQGFPMRPDIQGVARKRVLLTGGPGFHPKQKGERRRKSVRGNTISQDIVQVNAKIVKHGAKKLEQIFGKKEKKPEEKKPEEKPKEEAKPEKKEEVKPEEKKEEPKEEKAEESPKEEPKPEEKPEEKPAGPEKEEPAKKEEKAEEKPKEESKK
jgi:small subunit ribosomal protein S6e